MRSRQRPPAPRRLRKLFAWSPLLEEWQLQRLRLDSRLREVCDLAVQDSAVFDDDAARVHVARKPAGARDVDTFACPESGRRLLLAR